MKKTNVRYSEAFKQKVVKEISDGKFRSLLEAKDRYGIGGSVTINEWIKKYGKQDLLPRQVRIEMPDEREEIKKLKNEIKRLKFALSNAKVKEAMSEGYLEEICEEFGIKDIEALKKKLDAKLLDE